MATNTPRFGLRKPAGSDLINETADLADNMDKIDASMFKLLSRVLYTGANNQPHAGAGTEVTIQGLVTPALAIQANRKILIVVKGSIYNSIGAVLDKRFIGGIYANARAVYIDRWLDFTLDWGDLTSVLGLGYYEPPGAGNYSFEATIHNVTNGDAVAIHSGSTNQMLIFDVGSTV